MLSDSCSVRGNGAFYCKTIFIMSAMLSIEKICKIDTYILCGCVIIFDTGKSTSHLLLRANKTNTKKDLYLVFYPKSSFELWWFFCFERRWRGTWILFTQLQRNILLWVVCYADRAGWVLDNTVKQKWKRMHWITSMSACLSQNHLFLYRTYASFTFCADLERLSSMETDGFWLHGLMFS